MARVRIDYDDKELRRNIHNLDDDIRRAIAAVTDRRAAITTSWLKTNAHWTDRTGAARSGLYAVPVSGRNYTEIFMAYSVSYGIWLEIAHDRKYSIITPAMRIMGQALIEDMQGLLDHLEKYR